MGNNIILEFLITLGSLLLRDFLFCEFDKYEKMEKLYGGYNFEKYTPPLESWKIADNQIDDYRIEYHNKIYSSRLFK